MSLRIIKFICIMTCIVSLHAFAATESKSNAQPKIRYKAGKEINFGATTIQGGVQRPDIAVVTGSDGQGDNGLLRLRENFMDRIASDFAEEVQ